MDSLKNLRSSLALGSKSLRSGLFRARSGRREQFGPIGLELSLDALHMVQLRHSAETSALQAFASVAYTGISVTPGDSRSGQELQVVEDQVVALCKDRYAIKQLVAQSLNQADFRGRRVVASMPAGLVRVMPVSYQLRIGESDDAAIAALMSERLGEEAAELVIDYMPVQTLADSSDAPSMPAAVENASRADSRSEKDRQARERLALVAVCRQESVLCFADNLHHAGLDVVTIEIGPIAIWRLVTALQKNRPPQNTLVLNCGRKQSYLTVIADNRLLADDQIEVGETHFFDEVARRLDLPDDLASRLVTTSELAPDAGDESARMLIEIIKPLLRVMVREIERGLVYAGSETRGTRQSQVYLLGSLARWRGAAALLQSMLPSMLQVSVSVIPDPVELLGDSSAAASPELAVATGLALNPGCDIE